MSLPAAALGLTLAVMSFAVAEAQQQGGAFGFRPPPTGSYQRTCRNVILQRDTLAASCATRTGAYVVSRLDISRCGSAEIFNDNGTLRCTAPPAVPAGSYQRTCRNAALRGNTLTATCSRRNGTQVATSLDISRCRGQDIGNDNGTLVCGRRDDDQGRGRGRGGRDDDFEAVVYTRPRFRGQQMLITEPVADLAARRGFNNTIRSIRVLRGRVEVCADPQYRGRCVTLDESASDLGRMGLADAISSIRGDDDRGRGRGRDRDDRPYR